MEPIIDYTTHTFPLCICSHCGVMLLPGWRYCPACGDQIDWRNVQGKNKE